MLFKLLSHIFHLGFSVCSKCEYIPYFKMYFQVISDSIVFIQTQNSEHSYNIQCTLLKHERQEVGEKVHSMKYCAAFLEELVCENHLLKALLLLLLLSHFSRVWLHATPETAAHQAPPSLGFSRQEHWSGLPFPSPMHESEKWKGSLSVVSDSSRPHGLQPTRLPHSWDFPGKSTGVGCHCLLQLKALETSFSRQRSQCIHFQRKDTQYLPCMHSEKSPLWSIFHSHPYSSPKIFV